ncbi:MAG TPA: LysR family transcriptional regulator [Terriglobales bacterium]|nr:LysR family transcriptional regulator [Terriglobales bacterium]
MHLSRVDLNLFVVLEAIYREGNITRAGQQLNLTQPAISHALKRLRDLLQDPLFVRQGAHMVPTPFTRNMIEQVRQALQILEANLSQSRNFVPEHTRRNFHLSLWEYAEALILPSLLQRLAHVAPGMSISTSRVKRRDLETELASGSVDLAIDIPMTMSDRIRHKWLLNEPFVVIARHGHPAIKDKLDLDTYLVQRHIQVSSRRHGPSLIDVELSRRGQRRRQVFLRSQHNHAACMVVSQTDMLLTLPRPHAQLLNLGMANAGLMNQVYPFPLPEPRLEAHLYWHESVENDPANRWLREEIEKVLAAEPREGVLRKVGKERRGAKTLDFKVH